MLYKRGKYWFIEFSDRENLLPGTTNGRYRKSTFTNNKQMALIIHDELYFALIGLRKGLDLRSKMILIPLSELKESFLAYGKLRKAESTVKMDEYSLNKLIAIYGEDSPMKQVNALHVQSTLLSSGLARSSVNSYMKHLHAIWAWAISANHVESNPFTSISKLRVHESIRRPFAQSEIKILFEVIDADSENDDLFKRFVTLAIYTGMRRNELLSILPKDIDLNNRLIYIPKRKNARPLILPLTDAIYALIKDRLEHIVRLDLSDSIFPWNPTWVSHKFSKYVKAANLPKGLSFHSLRHTTPTILFKLGNTSAQKIQKLLGHSNLRMTEHYTHYSASDLTEPILAMEKWMKDAGLTNDSLQDDLIEEANKIIKDSGKQEE